MGIMTRSHTIQRAVSLTKLIAILAWVMPGNAAESARHLTDIPYANVDGQALALDLHLPVAVANPPLVVYVHGGAWRAGTKTEYPEFLVASGYAVASVEFRQSSIEVFLRLIDRARLEDHVP